MARRTTTPDDFDDVSLYTMRQKLECLGIIVDTDQLLVNARKNNKSTGGLDEEFRTIKRSYHRECLKKHPDKGEASRTGGERRRRKTKKDDDDDDESVEDEEEEERRRTKENDVGVVVPVV